MTTNSQLSATKTKTKTNKPTTSKGTESQKWRSHGRLSTGEWERGERYRE